MAGYSATPLAKKLGIKEGSRIFPIGAPPGYLDLLAPLPAGAQLVSQLDAETDLVHLFTTRRDHLAAVLQDTLPKLRPNAAIWVSWPKKSSRVPTDVTEDTIREVALPLGLVDIKVCAVDEVWSGLRLVLRKERRGS